ncbi:hypothetical protein MKW92_035445 [Papaver armeniacum]|nr:hypothetical protein MKW92_035445 [Papaver armeniacum]
MSSTIEADHDRFHETIMLSTKQIVDSQEAMLCKMNEAMENMLQRNATAMEAMLCKLIETQAQNQHQLLEMLTTRSSFKKENVEVVQNHQNLLTDITKAAGVSIEAVDSLIVILNDNQNSSSNLVDDKFEQVDEAVESSDHITQEAEDDQVGKEDVQVSNNYDYAGYEPLIDALDKEDLVTATEYVKINQTTLKEIFTTRDLKKESRQMIEFATAPPYHWKFLEEIVKVVTPETLEYIIPHYGYSVLQVAVIFGEIEHVKMLVEKSPKLAQIRGSWGTSQYVPFSVAVMMPRDAHKETVEYLYPITRDNFSLVDRNEDEPSPFTGLEGARLLLGIIGANCYGTALSFCQQYPERVKEWSIFNFLLGVANKPYAFLSGANLTWWERCIYSRIEVDIDHYTHNYAIEEDNVKHLESSKDSINRDEENPLGTSTDSSTSTDKEAMRKYISFHFKRCLMQGIFFLRNLFSLVRSISIVISVPCFKHIYDQKLAHNQAVALIKYLFILLAEKMNETGMSEEEQISEFQKRRLMETAIKYGTTELILECLQVFPYLHMFDMIQEESLFKLAIEERNEVVYNFICKEIEEQQIYFASIGPMCRASILHYAAELPTIRQLNYIPCEAFQIQREMQWFKGVESYLLQKDRLIQNSDGNTAHDVFMKTHKDLMEKGEKWMKDTSGSCMLVGALVATVAFAAAFTVPGGNISDNNSSSNGIPVFLKEKSFMVFAIADALSLFSSIASVLMFLAVYTSRYSAEDFLISLPQKLILGLGTLFVSMASILVSFSAAFTIILGSRFAWAPILVGLFGCVPVLLFGFLQFPLFVQMVYSTYWPVRFWKRRIVKKESRFASWKKSVRRMFQQSS